MKMTKSDFELLQLYARQSSQDAFSTLVARHVNLVYSTAFRHVHSRELAEEITQSVFADLARSAGRFKSNTVLGAWLHRVARFTAIEVMRKETRRHHREQQTFKMNESVASDSEWLKIEPLLDEAIEALPESDRHAILLRFFENKSLREIGQTLGTSEDAAQKRVSRALERLRALFVRQGFSVGSVALFSLLSANAVQAAPKGVEAAISSSAAVCAATFHKTTVLGIPKTIAMTTIQKTAVAAAIALTAGTVAYQANRITSLGKQNGALLRQQVVAAEQTQESPFDRRVEQTSERARQEMEKNLAELLKLRGEVTQLREEARRRAEVKPVEPNRNDLAIVAVLERGMLQVSILKQRLSQMPDQRIPELQFLSDLDWLLAIKDTKIETDFWQAVDSLHNSAKQRFARLVAAAMRDSAVDSDAKIPNGGMSMVESAGAFNGDIREALAEFSKANNGQRPTEPSQLLPYLKPIKSKL